MYPPLFPEVQHNTRWRTMIYLLFDKKHLQNKMSLFMPELSSMMTLTKWAIHNLLAPLRSWNRLSNKILEEMHMGWVDQLWIGALAGGGLAVALRRRMALICRVICIWKCSLLNSEYPYRKREWYCQYFSHFCALVTWINQGDQAKERAGYILTAIVGFTDYKSVIYEKDA